MVRLDRGRPCCQAALGHKGLQRCTKSTVTIVLLLRDAAVRDGYRQGSGPLWKSGNAGGRREERRGERWKVLHAGNRGSCT